RLKQRAFREREQRFLVEGAQNVSEAQRAEAALRLFHTALDDELVAQAATRGVETVHVSSRVIARLASTVSPSGIVAVARFVDVGMHELDPASGVVTVLHQVRDPGNAGNVVRSADGAGAGGGVFTVSSVDPYHPKTVRSTAGSLFRVPIVRGVSTPDAISSLRERGASILAADAHGDVDLYEVDLAGPTAFVFGNEAWGLPGEVASLVDVSVRVPLRDGVESLNLASAATLVMFECARRRTQTRRSALEAIIASAAHDIRSPLTAMKGFGYALAKRWSDMTDEQRSLMLEGIVYDTDRLDVMV